MTILLRTALAAATCCAAGLAHADPLPTFTDADEGFAVVDLGLVADDATCLSRARAAFDEYGANHGHHSTSDTGETAFGWDLGEDAYDGAISCVAGPNGAMRAMLVIYSAQDASRETAAGVASRVEGYFGG